VVDQLASDYAGQPVLFLEQDVDNPVGARYGRWWAAHGYSGSVTLPLVMVDSGQQISNGSEDFYGVYSAMVDTALARPPRAEITAYHERTGDTLTIYGALTNLSGEPLSWAANAATLHALIYEEAPIGATNRFVHAAPWSPIDTVLAPGAMMTFTLSATLSGVNWENVHAVALADYRPGDAAYDTLQAAVTQPPTLTVQPVSTTFVVDPAAPATALQRVRLDGPHILKWTAVEDLDWLAISPGGGSLPAEPSLAVDPATLAPGWQTGSVTFTASSASGLHFESQVRVDAYYGALERVCLPVLMR
jgi:hypothetical protein